MAKKRPYGWIAVAVGAAALVALMMRPRPLPVEAQLLSRGAMRVTLDEEGRAQVKRRYIISAPLAGKLLRVELKAGDAITEAAVLARLVPADAPLLDPRARAEQEARLHAAEAAASQAEANVARARVTDSSARDDLNRKRQLGKSNAISAHELDLAESEAASRTQDLASAVFGGKVAAQQLAQARAALQRGRSGRMEEFEILAPASGRVLRVMRESEGVVPAGTAIAEVGDPAALEIVAELLTADAVKVRPGMPAFIDHWGGSAELPARVRSVEPSGFTKLSALGVEEQRVRVLLDLGGAPAQWATLGDNFRVEVHVIAWQNDDVLRLPGAALFRRGDKWAAFFVEDGKARSRELEIGAQSAELAEVRGGAKAGDTAVLRPSESLRDGMGVAPIPPK